MRWGAIAVGVLALGCVRDEMQAVSSVRDSAGIEIVENGDRPAWSPATAWVVSDTPAISIGGNESDSTALFQRIRNVAKFDDGRIVVANGGTSELRFYDASGQFIRAVGGAGEGPGEFEWLGRALRTDGDSLVIWDPNNGRLTVFDSQGALARTVPMRSGQAFLFPEPFGRASDGSLIGRTGVPSNATGAIRGPAYFVRYGADLVAIDTIATLPSGERYIQPCGMGMCGYDPPFARSTSAAFHRDRLYVGTADTFEVAIFALDGRLIRSIRVQRALAPPSAADVARQRDAVLALARNPERRQELERVYAGMKVPETVPAFRDLRVDRGGNLWVEEYRVLAGDPARWTVFDSTGRLLGSLATPRSLRIDEIGHDYLAGVFRDSLDVEHARVHPIRKPPGR
jgi:hypothetical protein